VSSLGNSGYSGGNNIGLWTLLENKLEGDLLISNSDINISPDSLSYARHIFDTRKDVGQLYFETTNNNGNLIYSTIRLNGLSQKWNTEKTPVEINQSDYAAGSFFFIRRSIVELRNFIFDERFFMYWEEVDLSLYVKSSGFKVVCSGRYKLVRESNSSEAITNSLYYLVRNSFLVKDILTSSFSNQVIFYFNTLIMSVKLSIKNKQVRPLKMFFIGFFHGVNRKFGKNEKIHK
jgi:GT2 family glycosyltransferase